MQTLGEAPVLATRLDQIGLLLEMLGIALMVESVVLRPVMGRLGVVYVTETKVARWSPLIGLLFVILGMFIRGDLGFPIVGSL